MVGVYKWLLRLRYQAPRVAVAGWVHRFRMVMKNKPKFIPQHALAINARVCSIKNVFMLSEINRKVETTTAGKETATTSAKLVAVGAV